MQDPALPLVELRTQKDLMMGPVFIYLQLLTQGGQNVLWAQSKRLMDSRYWGLSKLQDCHQEAIPVLLPPIWEHIFLTGIEAVSNISSRRDFAAVAVGNLFEWLKYHRLVETSSTKFKMH